MNNLSCQEIDILINSWIYSQRDRAVLHRRLIDGIHVEPLAEEFELSVSQIKRIIKRGRETIASHCW